MQWLGAASLALFLTLSMMATAQIRGMPITPDQRMQLGTASGSVHAGTPSGIHVGGTFSGPSSVPPGIHVGGTFSGAGVPPGIHIGSTVSPPFPNRDFRFHHHHHPRNLGYVYPYAPYYYGAYAPYALNYGYDDSPYTGYVAGTFDTSPEYASPPQYSPSPDYYPPSSSPPPVSSAPEPQSYQQQKPSRRASDELAEPTVLVFRDGHRQEVANYAIMGSTLFVLSGPRSRIPVAELDVPATERENQSRGVDFHVPGKTQ
jgi:hypothetical protein